jgi:peptidoglycan/xylan/chitin deacetylase (PgdA/CDA1 family)
MPTALNSLASRVARSAVLSRGFRALTKPSRFVVLTYHRVNDDAHPYFGGVEVELFRRQMISLKRHFVVLPLLELVERAKAGEVPPNAAAITFDDGYRDNYTRAFPVLHELGLPATVFLVTDALDHDRLIWHDRVFDAFHRTAKPSVELDGETAEVGQTTLLRVLERVRSVSPRERDSMVDALVAKLEIDEARPEAWAKLRWDDVREMSRAGIEFGSHTLDHPILSHVDAEETRRQIRDSKARIEAELGIPVTSFAYPNGRAGDFDESTIRILVEEGYECAVTTVPGANDASTSPFALRRSGMWGEDTELSALRLAWSRVRA